MKHISHRRFLATFQLDEVSKAEQDLYRCVTQSVRGSGVSNFAELIVKGEGDASLCYGRALQLKITSQIYAAGPIPVIQMRELGHRDRKNLASNCTGSRWLI